MPIAETVLVTSGSSCRYEMTVGSQHLLYILTTENEPWTTGRCMGNKPLAAADSALAWLAKHGAAEKILLPRTQQ